MRTREDLEQMAYEMRKDALYMIYHSGIKGAHVGGSMSAIEILAVLYGSVMKYNPDNPYWDNRDRFIMSKAHGAVALYAALKRAGFLNEADIEGALTGESPYYEHPKMNVEKGLELSGGSLGQGLSFGVGTGLALQKKANHEAKVYVLLGDGECDEGSVWEAAAAVIHFGLKMIEIIVDVNGLQYGGTTQEIMGFQSMENRWSSMGFDVFNIDGHDVMQLQDAFFYNTKNPKVILANTIKGKGVSFAENKVEWHSSFFTSRLFEQAMEELERCRR